MWTFVFELNALRSECSLLLFILGVDIIEFSLAAFIETIFDGSARNSLFLPSTGTRRNDKPGHVRIGRTDLDAVAMAASETSAVGKKASLATK